MERQRARAQRRIRRVASLQMAEAVAAALEKQKRRNAALSDENASLQEAVALIAAGQKEVSVRSRARPFCENALAFRCRCTRTR